ncbi:MAG: glycosyl hydrolase [Gammaproteobacteria bacterium]|nr:MAG: glycosyl hydrolase [Gammaproteobacteria bacterium]PHR80401.1 MAG: glycosyl hydrolase [Colwellia sp.]
MSILNLLTRLCIGITPWFVIACLLYVGLFVKPQPVGSTVIPTAIESRDRFYSLVALDSVLWAVGADGKIVRSEDAGESWHVQSVPVSTHFQDITVWDQNIAVVVGNEGVVLHTSDGGNTWQQSDAPLNDVENKLLDVKAYANGEAWAVGAFGTLLFSRDYGHTWSYAREPADFIINEITKRDDGGLVAVGEFGTILISENKGTNWQSITAPVESSLMTIDFQNAGTGVAAGLEGVLLKTVDGGFSWIRVGNSLAFQKVEANPGIAFSSDWRDVTTEHIFSIVWHEELNRWFGVGTKGLWLEADPTAISWQSGRLAPKDLAWHTSISKIKDGVVLGGKNLGRWSKDHQWLVFQEL